MKRLLQLLLCLTLLTGASAWATCSGSGVTWSCTAGSTAAHVQSAVNSASDGATITLADGSYSWSTYVNLYPRQGITIQCASVRGCTITSSSSFFYLDTLTGTSNPLFRISGFILSGNPSTMVLLYARNNMRIRIDNNTFLRSSASGCPHGIQLGTTDEYSSGRMWGVIDNNIFTGSTNWRAILPAFGMTWLAGGMGSGNSIVIEDNQLSFTALTNTGCGAIDANSGVSAVIRYNTITNSSIISHGACHNGPYNYEIYGNTLSGDNGWAPIFHQGSGEAIFFNNTINSTTGIVVNNYRGDSSQLPNGSCTVSTMCDGDYAGDGNRSPLATYRGYPCALQPGRDVNAAMRPWYAWRNTKQSGAKADIELNSGQYAPLQFAANRDYYNAVSVNAQTSPTSPFNGTTGMGYGTKANRPTTCTPTSEALDAGNGGVGYWATDEGYWNSKTPGVPSGVLYRCSATNTWTLHYVPYPYPHPLRSGLAAPTGLTVQ